MSIYSDVKQHVSPKQCLKFYLGPPKKDGVTSFYLSPFRSEKAPSLAANDTKGISDFGTGEHYDAISFVSRLFNLSNFEAAQKLVTDFHLFTINYKTNSNECKEYQVQKGLKIWRDEARIKLRKLIKTLKQLLSIWESDEDGFYDLVSLKGDLETYEDVLNNSYDKHGWEYVFKQLGGDFIVS